jgi:hypothetical protein
VQYEGSGDGAELFDTMIRLSQRWHRQPSDELPSSDLINMLLDMKRL